MISHYLNQWWSGLLMHICATWPPWVEEEGRQVDVVLSVMTVQGWWAFGSWAISPWCLTRWKYWSSGDIIGQNTQSLATDQDIFMQHWSFWNMPVSKKLSIEINHMQASWQLHWLVSLIARFMRPTRGPSGADRTQVGPMLAPWTLLSGINFGHAATALFWWDVHLLRINI